MFRVGQKVACVDDRSVLGYKYCRWCSKERPIVGAIYTIKRVFSDFDGVEVVWLHEIARSESARKRYGDNIGYGAWRFRPIVERKTNIGIFKLMLTPTDKMSA